MPLTLKKLKSKHDELIEHLRGVRYIVINAAHGGFGLSQEAAQRYLARAGIKYTTEDQPDRHTQSIYGPRIMVNSAAFCDRDIDRDDPALVSVVREMEQQEPGSANGLYAELKIVKIPADVDWQIAEYDGWEWVAEKHRTWH